MTNKIAVIEKEFNGAVYKFREDGYFNMTHAAKQFGKHLPHFWNHSETPGYLEALKQAIPSSTGAVPLQLVEIIPGNRYVPERGTWAHPKLAVFFARWLDVKFAVFCDMVIDDLINGHAHVVVTAPEKAVAPTLPKSYLESLQELVKAVQENERLSLEVEQSQKVIESQKPKVEFVNKYVITDGSLGVRAAAKLLKMNMRELSNWLIDNGKCYRQRPANKLTAYAKSLEEGLFVMKTGRDSQTNSMYEQLRITSFGISYISENAPAYVRKNYEV